jgi:hypothetical protein
VRLAIDFAEGIHSLAGVPFFYDEEEPTIGLAYYVSGAIALQNFMIKYSP